MERDPGMTMRYQHPSPGHLRDAMRALDDAPKATNAEGHRPAGAAQGA